LQTARGCPRLYGVPAAGERRRVPGVRQWVLFSMPDHGGFFFDDPSKRQAPGMGQILYADHSVPVASVDSDLTFYDGGRRLSGGSHRAH